MNREGESENLPIGLLLGACGALLLIVALFLPWYEPDLEGFTVFEVLDLVLVLLALAMIASLAGGLGLVRPAPSPAVTLAVALFTVFVVLSQVLNDPPAVADSVRGKEIGIWLALAGAGMMAAGAVLAFAGISLAVEPRSRAPRGDGPSAPAADPAVAPPAPRRPAAAPSPPPGGDDPTQPLPDQGPERPA